MVSRVELNLIRDVHRLTVLVREEASVRTDSTCIAGRS